MKYLKTYPDKCIGCHTCESVCSQLFFKSDDPELSCIKITELEQGFDINVCQQCGKCIQICPTMALSANPQGVVILNKTKCIGCMACVSICPTHSMRYKDGLTMPFKCIACGSCVKSCPTGALEIKTEAI